MAAVPALASFPSPDPPRGGAWKHLRTLVPALAAWAAVVGLLAYLLYDRTQWAQRNDEANLREWLDESINFRKPLPELVDDYLEGKAEPDKADAIREELRAMADPVRQYQGQLPLFLVLFRLEVRFADPALEPIVWESPLPRPRRGNQVSVRALDYPLSPRSGNQARLYGEYLIHTAGRLQREEDERRNNSPRVVGLVLGAGALAAGWGAYLLRRERQRELQQIESAAAVEHAERLMLENQLRAQEAERGREELDRKLLEQRLEAARQESRAADAERAALELKSQLYASIGIMAGSYAHNIKNLLVRPNDLLARCIERDGLSSDQEGMLSEVRQTLGTVTERLQQILRTVRRDPSRSEMTRLDLNAIVRDMQRTWADMAREKWKLQMTVEIAAEPLWIEGDLSHLQQAAENLLFNARDATFEMRNHLRDAARHDRQRDPTGRKQALIEAAGWKGVVLLRTRAEDERAVLEVRDNGIGMTEEVRQRCMQTHFSTKRDNAIYEGYNAGMGLGLSFVAVVLEHHRATLEIESQPLRGALFRVRFPQV